LLKLLPAPTELKAIVESGASWWTRWKGLFPEISTLENTETMQSFVAWAFAQEDPVLVAIGLLCVGLCVRQLLPESPQISRLPLPPKLLMERYMAIIERIVIADIDYVSSQEGVQLMQLQAKTYVNLGQPRKGFLLFRHTISTAQVMGLYPTQNSIIKDPPEIAKRKAHIWWSLYEVDRFLSLLLGLPYAIMDDPRIIDSDEQYFTPTDMYKRKVSVILGRIIERNQTAPNLSIGSTLQIDQSLERLRKSMPDEWWDVASARLSGAIKLDEAFERLAIQTWHLQAKSFLHLPYFLLSASDHSYQYSRHACLEASRELLRTYHILRMEDGDAHYLVKIFDFQAFTSAVIVILGLLGYGQLGFVQDAIEQADCNLIRMTMDIFERAAEAEDDDLIIKQCLNVLTVLSSARPRPGTRCSENALDQGDQVVVVPYFGTIKLSTGKLFAQEQQTDTSSASHLTTDQTSASLSHRYSSSQSNEPSTKIQTPATNGIDIPKDQASAQMPHIDIDWTGASYMDLDQDWNNFFDGADFSL
jgi:hypothetical protein